MTTRGDEHAAIGAWFLLREAELRDSTRVPRWYWRGVGRMRVEYQS